MSDMMLLMLLSKRHFFQKSLWMKMKRMLLPSQSTLPVPLMEVKMMFYSD
jgi:hypothetical protein